MNIVKMWLNPKLKHLSGGWMFACALLTSGCVTVLQPPPIQSVEDKVVSKELAQESWAQVLMKSVDPQGRVAFKGVAKNPASLHRVILYISQTSPGKNPENFASPTDRLAYHLNSYNALAIYGVISYEFPSDFNSFTDRAKFLHSQTIQLVEKRYLCTIMKMRLLGPWVTLGFILRSIVW